MSDTLSSSSDEDIVIAAMLLEPEKKKWIHDINKKRKVFGEFFTLFEDLIHDDKKFFVYFIMSYAKFCELLEIVEPHITKRDTNYRGAITARERLAVTLRFLGHGDSFRIIALTYRLGESTVRAIVHETCIVIWDILNPIVMPVPTRDMWEKISERIWQKWQFPNGLGAIDGKHVVCEKPALSGSTFFNYKKDFSIVLLAVVDADYKFIFVDVGARGSESDGGIFSRSKLGKAIRNGTLDFPTPKGLPNDQNVVLPYVIVGDEAFPLLDNLMRPYPGPQIQNNEAKKIYNYRHSRFRRVSENAFGILSKKFRIYQRRLQMSPEHLDYVVLATTCLHNFLHGDDENLWQQGELEANVPVLGLVNMPRMGIRGGETAISVRDKLKDFFNSPEGSVHWQRLMVYKGRQNMPQPPADGN